MSQRIFSLMKDDETMKLNLNNPVLTALSGCFDALLATVYFILCCLPVVTMGAAITAVSATMLRIRRKECGGVTKTFFAVFRQNFKQSTVFWLLALVIGAVLGLEIWGCWFGTMEASLMLEICKGITVFFGILYCCICIYLFPEIGMFYVSAKQALKNALIFTIRNIPATLALIFLTALEIAAVVLLNLLALAVLAGCLYLQSVVLGNVFAPYLPETDFDNCGEEEMVY